MSIKSGAWPSVSVIVPTFRRFDTALDTVEELLQQDYDRYEIIVVDQNSNWPRDYQSRLKNLMAHHTLRWLHQDQPGVVQARNTAAAHSSGDVLLFVDDDVILQDPQFIRKHARNYVNSDIDMVTAFELTRRHSDIRRDLEELRRLRMIPSATVAHSAERWSGKNPLQEVLTFPRTLFARYEVCSFCTCNGSIRRSSFYALGGFDANFTGNSYGDDYDLAIRAREHRMKLIYDPLPSLLHLRSPLGGLRVTDRSNPFSERDRATSALIFVLRYIKYGMTGHLIWHHLLRKTILVKHNFTNPWRHFRAWAGLLGALPGALSSAIRGPKRGV